jgi:hypothetical protein
MRRLVLWIGVVVLIAVAVGFGLVHLELGRGRSVFQAGPGFFRTGSDTSYGGPLRVGQTYAQAGPLIANRTGKAATLNAITLQPWCLWTGPHHCRPSANVHIVKVLYLDGRGSLTND